MTRSGDGLRAIRRLTCSPPLSHRMLQGHVAERDQLDVRRLQHHTSPTRRIHEDAAKAHMRHRLACYLVLPEERARRRLGTRLDRPDDPVAQRTGERELDDRQLSSHDCKQSRPATARSPVLYGDASSRLAAQTLPIAEPRGQDQQPGDDDDRSDEARGREHMHALSNERRIGHG
jgi:hypothetical protein